MSPLHTQTLMGIDIHAIQPFQYTHIDMDMGTNTPVLRYKSTHSHTHPSMSPLHTQSKYTCHTTVPIYTYPWVVDKRLNIHIPLGRWGLPFDTAARRLHTKPNTDRGNQFCYPAVFKKSESIRLVLDITRTLESSKGTSHYAFID